MLDALKVQLEYNIPPTEVLLETLNNRQELVGLKFIGGCTDLCKNGTDFPTAWKTAVAGDGRACGFTRTDTENLISVGMLLGSLDAKGQVNGLRLYYEIFGTALSQARDTYKKYGKNLPLLGVLSGVATGIVLL